MLVGISKRRYGSQAFLASAHMSEWLDGQDVMLRYDDDILSLTIEQIGVLI